jgi:hypothetical protein
MSPKGNRPESVQFFGKTIFSRRSSRKVRLDVGRSRSSSSLSAHLSVNGDYPTQDPHGRTGSRRGTMSDTSSLHGHSRKHNISGPFNFQHLTHTRQEQLPNLDRASRSELLTKFSVITNSQTPVHGQLKGIRAEDLHFENFSSEDLNAGSEAPLEPNTRPRTSPQRPRNTLKKVPSPTLTHARSHESLRTTPPRPPRSPLTCPPPPPPRTSSRTASTLWDVFDPIGTTSLERPQTVSGFRKPTAFHLPISPPRPITRSEEPQDFIVNAPPTSPRVPDTESWPLLPGTFENNFPLADVPEEEEMYAASRRSRISATSADLRHSRSVPDFSIRHSGIEHAMPIIVRPQTPPSQQPAIGLAISPVKPIIQLTHESWEDDIDYCYEHAAEANCDYEWDRCSAEEELHDESTNSSEATIHEQNVVSEPGSPKTKVSIPTSDVDARRFRPSLLVPSTMDVPELSPMSSSSVDSPELRTPGLLRPGHFRSASHASSFKESHGFNLSPTLLIPTDFSTQMDQEALYDELFANDQDRDASIQHYDHYPISPVEGPSSTSSYRSSGFSRASNGASISKSNSHESVVLLSRAASVALQHRSISSSSSLPDLVRSYSMRSKRDTQELDLSQRSQPRDSAPAPDVPLAEPLRRKTSSGLRSGSMTEQLDGMLSPVREAYSDVSGAMPLVLLVPPPAIKSPIPPSHGRKISAPVTSPRLGGTEGFKGRKRAMSAKSRTSYGLFPQI